MKTTKEQRDALRALLEQATPRPWTAYRMVHADRGDNMTPEECGEYVRNSVIKSAAESGTTDFMAVLCEKPDGGADVCHTGNGPTSKSNAALVAAAINALPALLDALDAADHALDWEDVEDEWSADVAANHPTRNDGAHQHYATAMRMVGHRHSKGQLVSLVSWLLVRIATLTAERDKLRAEVEALRRKPMPPTDEEPLDPLSVVRALSSSGYEDELSDEERAACATVAAEVEALREVERYAREQDGETEMLRAIARLDALRKEKT